MFTREQECALAKYSVRCQDHYYGLSTSELKRLAFQFAVRIEIEYPEAWNTNEMAGWKWYYNFMSRHPEFVLRTPEQTSLNRVRAFCKVNVDAFFFNLNAVLKPEHNPFRIWNMDETGFSTVPSKIGKVISLRGLKKVGQICSQERGTMVTMALAVSAAGNSIPPMFLFPRKNFQSYFMDDATPNALGKANDSGWMCKPEFVQFLDHFIEFTNASESNPQILLIDNHSSHLSIEAIDKAAEKSITLLSFPPHCSHKLQPLDVSVYGPVKAYYKSICTTWQKNNVGKILEIRHIPSLVRQTLDLALTPSNVKAGFVATGICPYNPDKFTQSDFIQADVSEDNATAASIDDGLDENEQHRIIITGAQTVVPNEIVSASASLASASLASASVSPAPDSSADLSAILNNIGPMQQHKKPPTKGAKRGRKAMTTKILTSPENIAEMKRKRQELDDAYTAKVQRKVIYTTKALSKAIAFKLPAPPKT